MVKNKNEKEKKKREEEQVACAVIGGHGVDARQLGVSQIREKRHARSTPPSLPSSSHVLGPFLQLCQSVIVSPST